MGWTLALRPGELESFRRCPRAWDLGARVRQNYVPILAAKVFDFGRAMRDALAVYYFPAMDDWDRQIVRPLAMQAFQRKMREHRTSYEAVAALDAGEERDWNEHLERGQGILRHYFAWCAEVDEFDWIFADHEFRAPVPDPESAGLDLVAPDGRALRYVGRIDQLMDERDELWVVDHRLTTDGWADGRALVDDWVSVSAVWAMQMCYPSLKIAGNVYNEIRVDERARPAATCRFPRSETGAR